MDYQDSLDSKNLQNYLERIAKFPLFSEEEEKALGERIQQGDRDALTRLVESNLRFVVAFVKKYRGMGIGFLDLINEGNVGLIEAARRFDPGRGVRFISYAVWWIRQSVVHALSHGSRIYNIPQKLSDLISLMKRRKEELKAKLGRDPERDEVAKALGIAPVDVEDLELLAERNVSLSDRYGEDDLEVEERVSDEGRPSVEDEVIHSSIQGQVRELLGNLDEKEALVLKLRFGLDDDRPRTLQEIGEILNVTRERVRQIEQKAKRKLAQSDKLRQLRGYLN
ncbi:MAG: RNA polymerase sigma factor RpoD/SigA [Candidatus Aminicenantes bacterium]|nr:RNA polymerase sigma factor RpoD/SigA [Candidatus Aminicenantes bacterium]